MNILVIGRQDSEKNSLLKHFTSLSDEVYMINMESHIKYDSELEMNYHTPEEIKIVYEKIIETDNKRKLLIIENFDIINNLIDQECLTKLINSKLVTIIIVSSKLNFNKYNYLHDNFDILFLSSIYYDLDTYLHNQYFYEMEYDKFLVKLNKYINEFHPTNIIQISKNSINFYSL